ncbi:MAG TPA: alpha/beta hydrolase-fold protein [Gaiellaceae bacterium]
MSWQELSLASEALRGNPLGDLNERPLFVWSPGGDGPYPTVYVLHAHMRAARWWFNVEPFQRSYPETIDELAPEAVIVLVDGWTSVGGSQWIDSDGVGRYGTYLCEEVVPFVDAQFPTNGLRALQGKSSGGYGAIVNALRRPDLFHAVASHAAGPALFEVTLPSDGAAAARALRGRSLAEWFATDFAGLESSGDAILVELWSAALAFSGGAVPFDAETAELMPDVWQQWLAHDPVRVVASSAAAKSLRGVWLDAGDRDTYSLDLAAIALQRAFVAAGLPRERMQFELFPGGHRGLSWRYPLSLDWLLGRLSMTL